MNWIFLSDGVTNKFMSHYSALVRFCSWQASSRMQYLEYHPCICWPAHFSNGLQKGLSAGLRRNSVVLSLVHPSQEGLHMQPLIYPEDLKMIVARIVQKNCRNTWKQYPILTTVKTLGEFKFQKLLCREFMAEPVIINDTSPKGCWITHHYHTEISLSTKRIWLMSLGVQQWGSIST